MSHSGPPPASSHAGKAQSFKSRYKLAGMIGAVAVMWLDFALIYRGLVADDAAVLAAGMVIMLGGAAAAYYFG